jgi:DNA-binding GntR family transcriptional regulator
MAQFTQINSFLEIDTSHENIYRILRERICFGRISPGEVLSENALAQEFGVSRTPIRRVVQRLEYEHMVTTRHGVGTIVTPIDIVEIKELYELRMKLAELIGVLSPVAGVNKEGINAFESYLQRCREMYNEKNVQALARLNIEMHETQLLYIGNKALREIFDQLYYRSIRLWMQILSQMKWEEEIRAVQSEIEQTLEAMKTNDICTIGLIRRNSMSLCLGRIKKYIGGSA